MVDEAYRFPPPGEPDPPSLTTAAILREIANLEKLLDSRIASIEEAVKVAHDNLVRVPTDVDKAIGHLKGIVDERGAAVAERFAVMLEKFASVQTQFAERDTRSETSAKDSKIAIDAALSAQKESAVKQQESSDKAIAKSETATREQIKAIVDITASNAAALNAQLGDLKERLTRIEGQALGKFDSSKEHNTSVSMIIAGASVIIALVVGGSTILSRQDHAAMPLVVPTIDATQNARIDANTARLDQLLQRLPPPAPAK